MKRRWLVIAVVAAGAAFALVLLWPARPLWQANLGSHAYPLGFTADNRTLLAATGATSSVDPQLLDNPDGPPTLFRFDVATGRPLAEPQIVGPLNARGPVLVPSPDGQRLLVKGSTSGEAPSTHFLDLASGISRPLPRIGHSNTNHFSPDSRWFWVENLDPPTDHSLELRDGTTGEHVRRIPPPTPDESLTCAFAPDSSAIAVMRAVRRPRATVVEFCDVATGHVRRRLALPLDHDWRFLEAWHGDRLFVAHAMPNQDWRTVSFDLTAESDGGRDEHLTSEMVDDTTVRSWTLGPTWRARQDVTVSPASPPTWRTKPQAWLAERTGWSWLVPARWTTRLKFYDDDRERSGQPPPLPEMPIISRDGRLVATGGERFQVWDADPGPRWPWACLAGVGVMLPVLMFGRWRRKR